MKDKENIEELAKVIIEINDNTLDKCLCADCEDCKHKNERDYCSIYILAEELLKQGYGKC